MAAVIYSLCALLSVAIAALLWRSYARRRTRIVYWSALCFSGLAVNNALLVLDRLVFLDSDWTVERQFVALLSVGVLVFGLVYEEA